jgi:hypothetical protein
MGTVLDIPNKKLKWKRGVLNMHGAQEIAAWKKSCNVIQFLGRVNLPDEIQCQFAHMPVELRGEAEALFIRHTSLFRDEPLGCNKRFLYKIVLTEAKPIKQVPYCTSPAQQAAMKKQLDEMLEEGIV